MKSVYLRPTFNYVTTPWEFFSLEENVTYITGINSVFVDQGNCVYVGHTGD